MKAAAKTTQGQSVWWWGKRAAQLEGREEDFSAALHLMGKAGMEFNHLCLEVTGPAWPCSIWGLPAPSWCSSSLCPHSCLLTRIHRTHRQGPQEWTAEQAPLVTLGSIPSAKGKGRNCRRTYLFCNYG